MWLGSREGQGIKSKAWPVGKGGDKVENWNFKLLMRYLVSTLDTLQFQWKPLFSNLVHLSNYLN